MANVRHVRGTHSKHVVQAIPHARFVPQTINAHTVTGTGHAQFVLNTINVRTATGTLMGPTLAAGVQATIQPLVHVKITTK
jgi:hypothetical protein